MMMISNPSFLPGHRDDPANIKDDDGSNGSLSYSEEEEGYIESRDEETGEKDEPVLVNGETKWVMLSKTVMLLVLAFAAASTTVGVYFNTKFREEESFNTRFTDFANQITSVSQVNAGHILETYSGVADLTRSNSRKAEFPLATVGIFEELASEAVHSTGANYVGLILLLDQENRTEYEDYTFDNQDWIQEALEDNNEADLNITQLSKSLQCMNQYLTETDTCPEKSRYAPVRQISPVHKAYGMIGVDLFSLPYFKHVFDEMLETNETILSEVVNLHKEGTEEVDWPASFVASLLYTKGRRGNPEKGRPAVPSKLAGAIAGEIPWHRYFSNLVPEGIDGIYLVVKNTCNQKFSYMINGPEVTYLGEGDFHDEAFQKYQVTKEFTAIKSVPGCSFTLNLFPTEEFEETYITNAPITNSIGVLLIFLLCMFVFVLYDYLVEKRKDALMTSATKTGLLVNSLFPANVRDRLLEDAMNASKSKEKTINPNKYKNAFHASMSNTSQTGDSSNGTSSVRAYKSPPIADVFPNTTVLFGDLAGFTAWSSERSPSQVFVLLETVYNEFDTIAKKLKVFKVETIGDCYLACAGLPEPREDHALVMARFARRCMAKLNQLVFQLEIDLGIGTSDLSMRFGLHSGPVTAGVLRGAKSRFQLFGDTVNTAARMESNGLRDKIQLSEKTAELLIAAGKGKWITPRETKVEAKGKGQMQTYWLSPGTSASSCSGSSGPSSTLDMSSHSIEKAIPGPGLFRRHSGKDLQTLAADKRKTKWNAEMLQNLLKRVVATREAVTGAKWKTLVEHVGTLHVDNGSDYAPSDELEDAIPFPTSLDYKIPPETVEIPTIAAAQLYDYVESISSLYNECRFHSFAHATHVNQSVEKLLSRIVATSTATSTTTGMAADPMAHFVCAFAALIHDVDHPGVPNHVLVAEQSSLAATYKNKSVSEQHSLDVAWTLLMEDQYKDLRACIYTNASELKHFRQLLVHSILATDIMDRDLCESRKSRWESAFSTRPLSDIPDEDNEDDKDEHHDEHNNLKATLVMEHLIQASDLSHMMQHWHV